MRRFRADLHIHTVLSACADLEMSPGNIVRTAKEQNIDLIAVTDHNSTLHCPLLKELAEEAGLAVVLGTEVTSREEVHCLAYFGDLVTLAQFQEYIWKHLPSVSYLPEKFGYQVLVDREEKIISMFEEYLNLALDQSIDQMEQEVHRLGGIFVPAHVERPMFGIFNQLGFVPDSLVCDAMGIMPQSKEEEIRTRFGIEGKIPCLKASDAHRLEDIGSGCSWLEVNELTFEELKMALACLEGRRTTTE